MADIKRYVVSLPERATRATAALAGGAIQEVTNVVLPDAVRQSRLYQATIARLVRIVVELVGDVHGVYPADAMPAGELAVRKTAGNVMEIAGLAAVGWSPLWLLAAAADVLGGSKTYLRALVSALEAERVLPAGTDIASYDDLLTRLETTSGTLADAIDVPPMTLADARASLTRLRDQGRDLPSPEELGAIFAQLQETARRENRSVAELSAVIGLAAARTGIDLGNTHIFDFYRQAFAEIGQEGLLRFLQRVASPYVRRAGGHFVPSRGTYTDRVLDWFDRRRAERNVRRDQASVTPEAPAPSLPSGEVAAKTAAGGEPATTLRET